MSCMELLHLLLEPKPLLEEIANLFGPSVYFLLFGVIFAESGLLFGFFLPGDSLLIAAGLLTQQGVLKLPIFYLAVLCFVAAVLGDSVGYWFGNRVGRKLFTKEDSLLFHKQNLLKAEEFYEKHGGKTIILARFMPFIRTFAPIVAGIGRMNYQKFLIYNIVGGILWGVGLTYAGFYLGQVFPDIDKYLLLIIASIIFLSVLPPAYHFFQAHRKAKITKTIS